MILLRTCFGKYISANKDGNLTCEDVEKAEGLDVINRSELVPGEKFFLKLSKKLKSKYIVLRNLEGKYLNVDKNKNITFSDHLKSKNCFFETFKFEKY